MGWTDRGILSMGKAIKAREDTASLSSKFGIRKETIGEHSEEAIFKGCAEEEQPTKEIEGWPEVGGNPGGNGV